ncbi:MAG: TolC family protein [Candidatus Cloacimonetes bacterium]|nr:TolC family protein [Candidatus Cloacimonadota bacterium]
MKKIFLCALMLVFAGTAFAESFTIDKVIQIGLENSYDITNQTYSMKKSKQSLYSSVLDILPNANYSISQTEAAGTTTKSGSINISETIYSDDYRYFSITNGLSSLKKSKIDLEITRKNLIYNIISSYLNVLLQEKLFDVSKMALKIAQMNYDETKTLRDYGKVSEIDMRQAEIDLSRAQIDSLKNNYNFENSKMDLCFMISVDYKDSYTFDDIDYEIMQDQKYSLDIDNNLSVNSYKESLKQSKMNYIQNWLEFIPTLSFSVNKSLDWEKGGLFDFNSKSSPIQYTIALSYPLLNPLTNLPSNKTSHYSYKQAKLLYEHTKKQEQQDFLQAVKYYNQLQQSYELAQKQEALSEMHFNLVNEKYRLGQADLTELENARQERFQSMSNRISQYYLLIMAQENIHLINNDKLLNRY